MSPVCVLVERGVAMQVCKGHLECDTGRPKERCSWNISPLGGTVESCFNNFDANSSFLCKKSRE